MHSGLLRPELFEVIILRWKWRSRTPLLSREGVGRGVVGIGSSVRERRGGTVPEGEACQRGGESDSLCRDGRVMVVNRRVQPQALTFFTEC